MEGITFSDVGVSVKDHLGLPMMLGHFLLIDLRNSEY